MEDVKNVYLTTYRGEGVGRGVTPPPWHDCKRFVNKIALFTMENDETWPQREGGVNLSERFTFFYAFSQFVNNHDMIACSAPLIN